MGVLDWTKAWQHLLSIVVFRDARERGGRPDRAWKKKHAERGLARRSDPHCTVYFVMPDPFELLPCWCNGLTGTLPCEARACWLSLPARIFRSFVRPLTSRSENSRASIDEIARVSDGGINQRLQARRIKRKNTRGFLILRPTRKPPYERLVRRVSQDRSSADCL